MYSQASLATGSTFSQKWSIKPHHYACWEGPSDTQKRKPGTENPGTSPRNIILFLKTIREKSGFCSYNFCTLSPFQLSLPNSILRCIPAWNCVLSACLPDILCFHRQFQPHTAAQLLPQMGKCLFATAAVSKVCGGWSNPMTHFHAFSRRCWRRRRDIELNWDFPTQKRVEELLYCLGGQTWVISKCRACFSPPEIRLPTKPNQKENSWWNQGGSAFLKLGQLWGAWTYLPFEFICPGTWDQTEKRGRRQLISHQILSSENGPGNRTGMQCCKMSPEKPPTPQVWWKI